MGLVTIKRLAAGLLKCGTSRIRILDAKKAEEALTREDARRLIKEGVVVKIPEQGVGRGKAKRKHVRKQLGRRRGVGSRKGTPNAVQSLKEKWMQKVRGQRRLLKSTKSRLDGGLYRKAYRMAKGSAFRTKKQLVTFLEETSSKGEAK
ncbi:TPA: 50S ribosomal protein L19e [Candidatus Micrarchaeota archaeon]|nr:50S ribosomal protein L19e [Candidatus Micrarchaeota archaeon]